MTCLRGESRATSAPPLVSFTSYYCQMRYSFMGFPGFWELVDRAERQKGLATRNGKTTQRRLEDWVR